MISRRKLVLGTAAIAITGMGGGALYYSGRKETGAASSALPESVPLVRPYSPVVGPVDAPVTIVEFFDPACEACRAFHPFIKEILAKYPEQVRVVLRYAAFHPTSEAAIRILEAARQQGMFDSVLEVLFQHQSKWAPHGREPESVWHVVEKVTGFDVEKAKVDAQNPDIVAVLNQDSADVVSVGVKGTPTFFVNRKPLPEFGPKQLITLVQNEVAASR